MCIRDRKLRLVKRDHVLQSAMQDDFLGHTQPNLSGILFLRLGTDRLKCS